MYRSQILQIAAHLQVPVAIRERSPNPEMIPGIDDKYMDILGIDGDAVDLVLHSLEAGMPASVISEKTGVDLKKVEEISELIKATAHMRHHAMCPPPL
jgi:NAD+ synthase